MLTCLSGGRDRQRSASASPLSLARAVGWWTRHLAQPSLSRLAIKWGSLYTHAFAVRVQGPLPAEHLGAHALGDSGGCCGRCCRYSRRTSARPRSALGDPRSAPRPRPPPRAEPGQQKLRRLLSDSELNVLWKWLPDRQTGGAFRTGPRLNIKSPSLLVRTEDREAGGGRGEGALLLKSRV